MIPGRRVGRKEAKLRLEQAEISDLRLEVLFLKALILPGPGFPLCPSRLREVSSRRAVVL